MPKIAEVPIRITPTICYRPTPTMAPGSYSFNTPTEFSLSPGVRFVTCQETRGRPYGFVAEAHSGASRWHEVLGFEPTHLMHVEESLAVSPEVVEEYRHKIFLRLLDQCVRHCAVTLSLCGYSFALERGPFYFRDKADGPGVSYGSFEVAKVRWPPVHANEYRQWDEASIARRAVQLWRYYNPDGPPIVNRVTVALQSFWAAVTTPNPEQEILSLTIIFEAMLSTGNAEISHQVAERLAALLEAPGPDRLATYRDFKKLYELRSLIVHGGMHNSGQKEIHQFAAPKDSSLTVHSSGVRGGETRRADLRRYSIRLLNRALDDEGFLSLLCGKDQRKLVDFFLEQLLGAPSSK